MSIDLYKSLLTIMCMHACIQLSVFENAFTISQPVQVHMYGYKYIHRERERETYIERERERDIQTYRERERQTYVAIV